MTTPRSWAVIYKCSCTLLKRPKRNVETFFGNSSCCWCYPLRHTMLQCEHPLSGSRPSRTEYDCMPRCHVLSCTPWCVFRSACSISSSDARSPRVFHPCYLVPRCPLPRFQRPRYALENCRCIFQVSGWRQTRDGLRSTRAGQCWRSVLSTPATQGRMSVWPRAPEAGELHQPSSVSSLKARWSRLSNSVMSHNRLV